ncbi:MAG: molybdenum cofactor biosynthesis protein MoeB [Gemmatimonas sp.]|nr:molybdenum cofactor biosynthesis protein MoeB [Gemmatimonas sp.]
MLSSEERARYQRQLSLPEIGDTGQERLRRARVLLVGLGGLGSPAALYLAAAGVGHLGLVDHDRVDVSNLHRQVLHGTPDVGRPKVESAREHLQHLNPLVQLDLHDTWLTRDNALELVGAYDVIVDGADTFATRYLVNDACVLTGRPNVHASVFRFDGQASVFCTSHGPCYRCLYPSPPPADLVPSCAVGGVLGVLPGLLGLVQATETLKLLLGIGEPLVGRLFMLDALHMHPQVVPVSRDPSCPACGTRTITALADYAAFCGTPTLGVPSDDVAELAPAELQRWLREGRPIQLLDVREPFETAQGMIPGAEAWPLATIRDALPQLDMQRPIVCICAGGVRSRKAAATLISAGCGDVYSLAGGMSAWSHHNSASVPG